MVSLQFLEDIVYNIYNKSKNDSLLVIKEAMVIPQSTSVLHQYSPAGQKYYKKQQEEM